MSIILSRHDSLVYVCHKYTLPKVSIGIMLSQSCKGELGGYDLGRRHPRPNWSAKHSDDGGGCTLTAWQPVRSGPECRLRPNLVQTGAHLYTYKATMLLMLNSMTLEIQTVFSAVGF